MFNTGADYAFSIIGGKWKPVILCLLANLPRRTEELVRQLGTSHKVLSDQLCEPSDAEIVARKSFNTIPPHVEYRLTPEGEDLYAAIRYLNNWGDQQVAPNPNIKIMCINKMKKVR
ncbi:helix-turn-helix transcriptional regulator [Limosilactobacillus fastidiosus]|nr:helix-turn-helix domain-containing protein [Limosilactobacillus fastidiosus]MCD7083633.1 helix-turn-helix transcriptional regulator [Limosilactobacillus fastidiosus]